MADLTQRYQEAVPDSFVSTPEGDKVFDFYGGVANEAGNSVVTYRRRPVDSEPYEVEYQLAEIERETTGATIDTSFVRNSTGVAAFEKVVNHLPLVNALGYRWNSETAIEDGVLNQWTEFNYPSAARLNSVLDQISPEEGLRFKSYPGGQYSAIDHAEALLDNTGLIAEQQPYQAHDHAALHILGQIGLHGEYLQGIKDFTKAYLARYRAELALPAVPDMEYTYVADLLHPAHQVLRSLVTANDALSAVVGDTVFRGTGRPKHAYRPLLEGAVRGIYFLGTMNNRIPSGLFDEPHYEVINTHALAMEARYDRLSAAVLELAA
jgi:hypothetical protein